MASVKIIRRLKSSSAAQPADQQSQSKAEQLADQVDARIVDAAWQNLADSPTEDVTVSVHGHFSASLHLLITTLFIFRRTCGIHSEVT